MSERTGFTGTDTPAVLDLILAYSSLGIIIKKKITYDIPREKSDHVVLEFNYVVIQETVITSERTSNPKKKYKAGNIKS